MVNSAAVVALAKEIFPTVRKAPDTMVAIAALSELLEGFRLIAVHLSHGTEKEAYAMAEFDTAVDFGKKIAAATWMHKLAHDAAEKATTKKRDE